MITSRGVPALVEAFGTNGPRERGGGEGHECVGDGGAPSVRRGRAGVRSRRVRRGGDGRAHARFVRWVARRRSEERRPGGVAASRRGSAARQSGSGRSARARRAAGASSGRPLAGWLSRTAGRPGQGTTL